MKKIVISSMAIAAFAFAMTSCNQQNPKVEEKSEQAQTELKIAYVEVDSIMSQYKFCKEYSQILEKKSQNIQNTINAKGQQLQAAAANFQQKIQQNAYTREQAEAIQASLQKQNNDLQALQQRLGTEFQAETEKFNVALRDSIQHFLAKYNKDKKFSIILSKQGDNLLYADKTFDITNDVVAGLNKAYKSTAPKTEEKATAKEEKKETKK